MRTDLISPLYTLLGLLWLILPAVALQASLAGVVDWHKPLIGQPLLDPTPPSLIETANGRRIISITKSNAFSLLDAVSGDIVWRYKLEDNDPVVSYHVHEDSVLLLSGPSGSTARLFSIPTGQVKWEKTLHETTAAHLTVPVHLGTDVGFSDDGSSVVILSDGRRITKLSMEDGTRQWSLEAPGAGDTILFKQILVTGETIHTLALTSNIERTTLTTLSFSLLTSAPLGDFTQIPSVVSSPSSAILAQGHFEGTARIVWTEYGRIRAAYLTASGSLASTKEILPGNGQKYSEILDVGSRFRGLVLGKKEDGAVQIVNVNSGKRVDEFENSHDSADKSPSVYSASIQGNKVTFNRVYWSFSLNLAVAETNTVSDGIEAITTGFTFPFDTESDGVILHSAVNANIGPGEMPHILLTTSSGALSFVSQEKIFWTREESLADLAAVKFIELGEREVEKVQHVLEEENYLSRTTRHLAELKDLPGYIIRFAKRLVGGNYASTLHTPPLNATNLHRDQFGLQKLVVLATKTGKLVALDSSNGKTVWSKNLGITTATGAELNVESVWVVREVGEGVNPTLAVIATRNRGGVVETVGYHVDAFTGRVSTKDDAEVHISKLGKVIFEGRSESIFLTPFTNCGTKNRVLGVMDSEKRVHIFPSCKKVAKDLEDISSKFFFTTTTPSLPGSTVSGHVLSSREGTTFKTLTIWSIPFTSDEHLSSTTPASFGPIASYGRALGDKSTLYKYLNPHLIVLTTAIPEQHQSRVFVVDSTTGRTVYEVLIKDVVLSKGVKVAMSENWLVYSWLSTGGWRIGSVELYEESTGGKGVTPGIPGHAEEHENVEGWRSQTFIAPGEIKALGMTNSKFGITAKDVIYINGRNQIATIPRRLLDPRRPLGKPTSTDKEEMLIPYDPALPSEPKWTISHKYQVLGAKYLTSSPALLESTSLLLVHGLDLFFTRGVNPSGTFDILTDGFNKVQLLLTLAGLSVGIAIARPAVKRKALKAKWFS